MRTAINLDDFIFRGDAGFRLVADHVVEAERLGVDTVWSAEAWGTDGVVPLAYLAARTSRIRLATGILQITARAPAMTAMTAMTLDHVSDGRFILGLGASGPQVVEGLHGRRYDRPLERLRETVDVIRLAMSGERIVYDGNQITLPLPDGPGKALRIGQPARPNIPIYLATLGPRALEYTGSTADGWVATCFVPQRADHFMVHIRRGAERAGRDLSTLQISAGGPVAITDDVERPLSGRRKALAFQVSAMGSADVNFYSEAYARLGYVDEVENVRRIWLSGDHQAAANAVPDDWALGTSFIGSEGMITERIRAYRHAGVTELRLQPMGRDPVEKLDTLARMLDLVRAESQAWDAQQRAGGRATA